MSPAAGATTPPASSGDGTFQPDSVPVAVTGPAFTRIVGGGWLLLRPRRGGPGLVLGRQRQRRAGQRHHHAEPGPDPGCRGLTFTQISASGSHTCALDAAGAAWCWGNGGNGRIGDGLLLSRVTPTSVAGGHVFTQISAGAAHTCARRRPTGSCSAGAPMPTDGSATAPPTQRVVPTPVAGATRLHLRVGGRRLHVRDSTLQSAAWCWGAGSGQVGDATNAQREHSDLSSPEGTPSHAGYRHGTPAASRRLFAAFCWGENANGRLGDGTGRSAERAHRGVGRILLLPIIRGQPAHLRAQHQRLRDLLGRQLFGQLGDGTQAGKATPVGVKQACAVSGEQSQLCRAASPWPLTGCAFQSDPLHQGINRGSPRSGA